MIVFFGNSSVFRNLMILSLVFFRVFVDRGVFSVIRRREYLFSFGGEVGFGLLFVGVLVGREVWFNKF